MKYRGITIKKDKNGYYYALDWKDRAIDFKTIKKWIDMHYQESFFDDPIKKPRRIIKMEKPKRKKAVKRKSIVGLNTDKDKLRSVILTLIIHLQNIANNNLILELNPDDAKKLLPVLKKFFDKSL